MFKENSELGIEKLELEASVETARKLREGWAVANIIELEGSRGRILAILWKKLSVMSSTTTGAFEGQNIIGCCLMHLLVLCGELD